MFNKAATAGNRDSMYRLGLAELHGELNTPKDIGKAVKWFKRGTAGIFYLIKLVADKKRPEPIYQLALIYETGSPPLIQSDPAYSLSLFREACKLEYLPAIYHLAHCYEYGTPNCPPNPVESFELYSIGAEKGDAGCQLAIAGWYMTGIDTILPKDDSKAFEWTKKASDQGLPRANYTLGILRINFEPIFWSVALE